MLAPTSDGPLPGPFVPDRFFMTRTRGRGVVRNRSGRLVDTCAIATESRWDHARGALHIEEVFTFDGGRMDTLLWVFAPNPQGRMVPSELSLADPVRGWSQGDDYRMRFRRADPRQPRAPRLTYDVRISLMDADLALKQVCLRRFGLTVATVTAFYRQLRP
jgi:hypothetical protein